MEIIKTNCVNCGSPIDVDPSKGRAVCEYCNTPFIYETKEARVNVSNLFEMSRNAENSENFVEALKYYNKILQVQPNNVHALLGKAFCSLAVFTYDKLNFKEFEFYFNKAVELNDDDDILQFHTMILDKMWALLGYSAAVATQILNDNYSTNPTASDDYVKNMIVLHKVQQCISDVVDIVSLEQVSEEYIDCYVEFKTASVAHSEQIFSVIKKFRVDVDKQMIKQIKEFMSQSEKQLKNFKKKFC